MNDCGSSRLVHRKYGSREMGTKHPKHPHRHHVDTHPSAATDSPLFPEILQLIHGPCRTTHSRKQDVDAAIANTPEGITKVE